MSSSKSGDSSSYAPEKARSTAGSAAAPVVRTHSSWLALGGSPNLKARMGSTSSWKARTPSSPPSTPPLASSALTMTKSPSSAAARTLARPSSRTAVARQPRSGHHSRSGPARPAAVLEAAPSPSGSAAAAAAADDDDDAVVSTPRRSSAHVAREPTARSAISAWRCWRTYSQTHSTHSPTHAHCAISSKWSAIVCITISSPVAATAGSAAASAYTANIERQPERIDLARDWIMWPRQPRMKSFVSRAAATAIRSWKGLRNSRWNW